MEPVGQVAAVLDHIGLHDRQHRVAAGAVVTRDVAPYTIVAGTPARVLRPRQPPEIAKRLIALAWWDWDHGRIRVSLDDFRSMSAEAFLEKYETDSAIGDGAPAWLFP